jgi:hypothetical protein
MGEKKEREPRLKILCACVLVALILSTFAVLGLVAITIAFALEIVDLNEQEPVSVTLPAVMI